MSFSFPLDHRSLFLRFSVSTWSLIVHFLATHSTREQQGRAENLGDGIWLLSKPVGVCVCVCRGAGLALGEAESTLEVRMGGWVR